MKIKKKISITIFTIAILIVNIPNCYASWASINTQLNTSGSGGSGDSGGGSTTIPSDSIPGYTYNNKSYSCSFNYTYNPNTTISASGYDLKGNYIFDSDNTTSFISKGTFLSGTSIEIAIKEEKSAYWKVYNIVVKEYKNMITCTYSKPSIEWYTLLSGHDYCSQTCKYYEYEYGGDFEVYSTGASCKCKKNAEHTDTYYKNVNESFSCPTKSGYYVTKSVGDPYTIDVTDSTIIQNCEKTAANKWSKIANTYVSYPTSQVEYIKEPNDYSTTTGILSGKQIDITTTSYDTNGTSGTSYGYYAYHPQNTCINLKTGNVSYNEKCKEDEGEISLSSQFGTSNSDTEVYWKYFIPLNTKTDSEFYLKIQKNNNSGYLSKDECLNVMDNYKNYEDYIQPISTEEEYCKKQKRNTSNFCGTVDGISDKSTDSGRVTNGCQISIAVNFDIEQEFYNEVNQNEEKKFNGFNFYYRPIDVENPFPNALGKNSLWSEYWNKEQKELTDIKLTNSYSSSNITYYTIINESLIRKYNKAVINDIKNSYTNWSNMTVDGESNFISKGYDSTIMIYRTNNANFYKLGCGPANDDKDDIQYMERCS